MVPCDEQRTKRGTGQKRRDSHIREVYFKGDWGTGPEKIKKAISEAYGIE